MSIKVMSEVWDIEGIDSSECLVLMALADHADDEGKCYPSIARLSKRTKLSDRGVQKVISRLIEKGFVTVSESAGRGGANLYAITTTPESRSPLNHVHPRTTFTTPPNHVRKTPEPRSPKPSGTIIEPSKEDHLDHRTDDLDVLRFEDFWERWPMGKVGKQKARTAFNRLSAQNRRLAIERVAQWAADWRRSNPTANDMHPTTYLNGKRWEDDFRAPQPRLAVVGGGRATSLWGKL